MSSTQKRQELARIRRQQLKAQQAWQARSHQANYIPHAWARAGMFDVIPEEESIAQGIRFRQGKTPVVFGNHFMTWQDHTGGCLAAYQEEIAVKNSLGQIQSACYRADSVDWTPHAVERLWQRDGLGIRAATYVPNLGLKCLDQYLNLVRPSAKTELNEAGHYILRTDLVVPFRGGALLGSIRLGEGDITYHVNKPPEFVEHTLKFVAHTWISQEQLRDSQQAICEALLGNMPELAADLMNKYDFRLEAIDVQELAQEYVTSLSQVEQRARTMV